MMLDRLRIYVVAVKGVPIGPGQFHTAKDAYDYIMSAKPGSKGGKITLRSEKTGTRFAYRISASPDGNAEFVYQKPIAAAVRRGALGLAGALAMVVGQ
jgi:hypothetical protein